MLGASKTAQADRSKRRRSMWARGLVSVVLLAAAGAAYDGWRWYQARAQVISAIEGAALAGAHSQMMGSRREQTLSAAKAFYDASTADLTAVSSTNSLVLVDDKTSFTVTGSAYLRTTFLNIAGIGKLPLYYRPSYFTANENLIQSPTKVEISLLIDVSGSMCDDGMVPCTSSRTLDALKRATQEFVDIVIHSDQRARVALVPWTSSTETITPLTAEKADLREQIAQLSAGGRSDAGGIAHAAHPLSTQWSSDWPKSAQPGSSSDLTKRNRRGHPLLRKIAVLVTDGVFDGHRGKTPEDIAAGVDRAQKACTSMKALHIEVFAVGVGLDNLHPSDRALAEELLVSCSTDQPHYYAANRSDRDFNVLQQALRDIAFKSNPLCGIAC